MTVTDTSIATDRGLFRIPYLIGVSGHRDLLPAQIPEIRAEVVRLLRRLRDSAPNVELQLLCPMADGADLLVAQVALELQIKILAVLTFPRDICRADLRTEQDRAVFDQVLQLAEPLELPLAPGVALDSLLRPGPARDLQFQRAGVLLARYSSLLIAIWDGQTTAHAAGTARVIEFRRRGIGYSSDQELEQSDLLFSAHDNDLIYDIRCGRGSSTPGDASAAPVQVLGFVGSDDATGTTTGSTDLPPSLISLLANTAEFNRDVTEFGDDIAREGRRLTVPSPYPVPETLSFVDRLFVEADWLGGYYRNCFSRTLKVRYTLWAAMAFALLAFKKMSTGVTGLGIILAVLTIFLAGWLLASWAHRRNWHRKYLDYRGLAEALRVDYYWEIAGVRRSFAGEFAHESFLQKQDVDLEWIRAAMRVVSLRLALRPSAPTTAGFAHAYAAWIGAEDPVNGSGQLLYYAQRSRTIHARVHRSERADRFLLFVGLLLAVSFAIDIACDLVGLRFLPGALRDLLLWALALLTVYAAIFEIYLGEKADRTLIRQYRYMHSLFSFASRELKTARSAEDKLEILRSLGHASLAEHAQWILAHRDKRIEGLKW